MPLLRSAPLHGAHLPGTHTSRVTHRNSSAAHAACAHSLAVIGGWEGAGGMTTRPSIFSTDRHSTRLAENAFIRACRAPRCARHARLARAAQVGLPPGPLASTYLPSYIAVQLLVESLRMGNNSPAVTERDGVLMAERCATACVPRRAGWTNAVELDIAGRRRLFFVARWRRSL